MELTTDQLEMVLSSILLKFESSSTALQEFKKDKLPIIGLGMHKGSNSECMYAITITQLKKDMKMCEKIYDIVVKELKSRLAETT